MHVVKCSSSMYRIMPVFLFSSKDKHIPCTEHIYSKEKIPRNMYFC